MEQKELYHYRNKIILNQTDIKSKTPDIYILKKSQ